MHRIPLAGNCFHVSSVVGEHNRPDTVRVFRFMYEEGARPARVVADGAGKIFLRLFGPFSRDTLRTVTLFLVV